MMTSAKYWLRNVNWNPIFTFNGCTEVLTTSQPHKISLVIHLVTLCNLRTLQNSMNTLGFCEHFHSCHTSHTAVTAKLILIDPFCKCSVQPLCLCIQIKLTKFGHKSEEGPDLQHRIFVWLMYYYLFFLILLYHGHQKHWHVGADIKYKLVFTSASLKSHILLK